MAKDVVILNNGLLERRTSKTGKQRYVMRVSAEPVVINTDPKALGKPIAEAIAHHLKERVKGITAQAAPATLKARAVAAKAFAAGKPWALQRYAGGRTGAMAPNQSDRAFNDSGRFAETIVANASSDGAWRVNVAANRLDDKTGRAERIFKRLTELLPEIANPALLLDNAVLKRKISKAHAGMVQKAQARSSKLSESVARQLLDVVFKALG